jgi:hypothetical protein
MLFFLFISYWLIFIQQVVHLPSQLDLRYVHDLLGVEYAARSIRKSEIIAILGPRRCVTLLKLHAVRSIQPISHPAKAKRP